MTLITEPTGIGELLASICQDKNWRQRLKLHALFAFWDEEMGAEIASKARPFLIRGTVLWINVTDSIWMQQLHLLKMTILEKINSRLDGVEITDLRFRMEAVLPQEEALPSTRVVKRVRSRPDSKRLREFDDMFSTLRDEEMREALKRLWLTMEEAREARK